MSDQSTPITKKFQPPATIRIAIIGLGYVGLPLAVEFAKKYPVRGFDIKQSRVDELNKAFDRTLETDSDELLSVLNSATENRGLLFTSQAADISACNVYIVSVPTPTDRHNKPDLGLLVKASKSVAGVLKPGDVVIYESTVYPGVTEEVCVPILQSESGLQYNSDFFAGYSPERINPGDKVHTLTNILKVTSGSTPEAADFIDGLYRSIVTAGTHKAPNIKVAEACKVIENSQRDINIAFVNELAKIFNIMGIDTHAVLAAAGTKWNFLNFKPGLVGGHCTGVDPYYLAAKAQQMGYHPEIILAGRRLNDGMGSYVAMEVIKLMVKNDIPVKNSSILILGFTFKENCPDVRNTRVIDIVEGLRGFDARYEIYDPWADPDEVKREYGITTVKTMDNLTGSYDAVIMAVAHREFYNLDYKALKKNDLSVIYDIKGLIDTDLVNGRL
ncbi:UDP-N-acetyl-D-galactosamine dehydrogenase [Mucilaginibacter oryzae]|uniref:UDP-N-acetyl-D-galactosamine dehydrogenase n=1 Tax=Mucilaginibacter oryzae TaxID=468058 RepID=A0A316GXY7_9SPHI|nr:nucleotide sugar dehydrogenase [Mucilaginibacter oryzae]PWK66331.1 UDP-N-acetyl-D-galactosamine dehydrogenase [Mucilaginibacter oryzae]